MFFPDVKHLRYNKKNRLRGDRGKKSKITVDGAGFRTYDTRPFDKIQFSHKFNGPELRYKLATNIQTGDIVHYNRPFKPGVYSDISIFTKKIKGILMISGEKIRS